MAKTLVVNNKSFEYPEQGDDPQWGEPSTDWASEVTDVLNSLLAPGDILQTEFTVANNQSGSAEINGFLLNTGVVRSAVIDYSIYRISTSNPSGNAETGILLAVYDNSASSGNKWLISQETDGNAGVTLSISDTGQFSYTSTDIGTLGYSGTMKFKSRSITSI